MKFGQIKYSLIFCNTSRDDSDDIFPQKIRDKVKYEVLAHIQYIYEYISKR